MLLMKLLGLAVFFYIAYQAYLLWTTSAKNKESDLGIPGSLLYADHGRNSKLFVSNRFNVSAKPDFIFRLPDGDNAIVEYKDRAYRVYESDIVQVRVSALAVRDSMPLTKAFVVTKGGRQEVFLPKSDNELHDLVSGYIEMARQVKSKKLVCVFNSTPARCTSCSVKHDCMKDKGGNGHDAKN